MDGKWRIYATIQIIGHVFRCANTYHTSQPSLQARLNVFQQIDSCLCVSLCHVISKSARNIGLLNMRMLKVKAATESDLPAANP